MSRPLFINGEWLARESDIANVNPSDTADVIGHFARGDAADVDAAVAAARQALASWRATTPQQRADILDAAGAAILADKDRIGRLLSREEGKTLAEGIGETARAGQIFKFYAQEALRIGGDAVASLRPGVDIEVTREPVGVVGIITPWNFPIAIPAWKIAPALAYGNTVVFKPAELVPGCAWVLAETLSAAGLPPGVFNLVSGPGSAVGAGIVAHAEIDALSFTGSVPVGRGIGIAAAQSMKKLQLEMGGKNPLIVMADADLDVALAATLQGAFYSTGQRCTASSRIIVEAPVYDAFVARLTDATRTLRVGNALDESTEIGPVVSEPQLMSNLRYVDLARDRGAEVIGGEALTLKQHGFYQQPALFMGVDNDHPVCREEIFGPCAAVIRADDFDAAVSIANDTEFGLCAGICTASLKYAREFKRQSSAGMTMVNLPTAGVDYHVPFGGRRASSFGPREQGRYAAEFYTAVKTSYTYSG